MAKKEKKEKKAKTKPTKIEKWFRTLRRFYRCVLSIVFPMKKYGQPVPLTDRAYLIIGNHLSVMDVIPAAFVTDKAIHYMAKRELFQKGFMKWFTKKCECIPINRDGSDVKALMSAMRYLRDGESVVVFPEGTRNKTSEMFLPFKSGAAAIAIKTKTPIVPMIQVKKIRMFRKMHVLYGEPFELSEFYDRKLTAEELERSEEILRKKLEDMYIELRQILIDKKVIKIKK